MKFLSILLSFFGLASAGGELIKRQPKVPATDEQWQSLVDYAGYPGISGILAERNCTTASNGATLLKYIDIKETDTQAAIWKHEATREIVLGLPGTATNRDWLTDFAAFLVPYVSSRVSCPSTCRVHFGFLLAWYSLAPKVEEELAKALADNPGYTTVISGHSLGGALATLAFGTLINGPYNVTRVYTYGQPRVGNQDTVNYLDGLAGASDSNPGMIMRATHADDGVPRLPPLSFHYVHTRTEYWEMATVAAKNSTYRCFGQEPEDCIASTEFAINESHSTYAGFGTTCV
ncbi:hypothetical protein CDD82_1743 [Ophiocordyceps australis]|uniref:Fungal lipase-type domain-containing protein n=1 Tax=Ophiocordyceps australis TaxID=1399860 RepID=A0A2C5ZM12_9HYPO|nr:hypothetical protein CDD82_1743 [Ophiocordyceps australis]